MSSTGTDAATETVEPTGVDWEEVYDQIGASAGKPQGRTQTDSAVLVSVDDVSGMAEAGEIVEDALAAGELERVDGGIIVSGHAEEESNKDVETDVEETTDKKPEPSEMERGALESEVHDLRERVSTLEDDMEFIEDQLFQLQDIVTGEMGTTAAEMVTEDDGGVMERLDDLEAGDVSNSSVDRSHMLPAHQMWEQYQTADGDGLNKSQRRTAVLFGEFVQTAISNEKTVVDTSQQTYKINTSDARRVLEDADELEGVSESSKGTLVARVMRDVHGLTKTEDCDCDGVDGCGHSMIDFRSGKPHALAVPKQQFVVAMENAYGATEDVASEDDATTDDPSEQDGEDLADNDISIDDLEEAETEADR